MEDNEYRTLVQGRLEQDFSLGTSYEGGAYDIAAFEEHNESVSFANQVCNRTVILVSFDCSAQYIEQQLEELAKTALSDFRSINKNKNTTVVRVFAGKNIPYSLIQQIKNYSFARNEHKQFWSYVQCGVIAVDTTDYKVFSNNSARDYYKYFKVFTPVETIQDTE